MNPTETYLTEDISTATDTAGPAALLAFFGAGSSRGVARFEKSASLHFIFLIEDLVSVFLYRSQHPNHDQASKLRWPKHVVWSCNILSFKASIKMKSGGFSKIPPIISPVTHSFSKVIRTIDFLEISTYLSKSLLKMKSGGFSRISSIISSVTHSLSKATRTIDVPEISTYLSKPLLKMKSGGFSKIPPTFLPSRIHFQR